MSTVSVCIVTRNRVQQVRRAIRSCLRQDRAADEIVVLDGGRIVERGTHLSLLALDEHYARMWRRQQQGSDSDPVLPREPEPLPAK